MAKIKLKSASLSSDPEVKAPVFRFNRFVPNTRLENNSEYIDFVTDEKSLYVCAIDGGVTGNTIGESSSILLKIVSQGEKGEKGTRGIDGAAGIVPEIGAEYIDIGNEKKLALTVDGQRKAMTGDLTPPVYVPTLVDDRYLTWEWNGDEPATIDLMKLRPINERPILLRTNSDNTKLDAEVSGPANFIQWKYEGDEHWTNLISIQELMNLAFAGMCTWEAADGKWHFGYKEVVKATYDSTKSGRRIINRVELGQILFDAGEIPLQDYGVEIETIEALLEELKNSVQSISIDGGRKLTPDKDGNVNLDLSDYAKKSEIPGSVDLDGYATETWVNSQGFLKNIPDTYAKKSDIPTDYVKSVNNIKPVNGNVTIEVGNDQLFDLRIRDNRYLEKTTNGQTWSVLFDLNTLDGGQGCDHCWTQEEILQLIEGKLQGVIPTDYLTSDDLDDYMTRTEVAAVYATMSWVSDEITRTLNGGSEVEYFRPFTLYTRSNSRTTPPAGPLPYVWEWNSTTGEILTDSSNKSGWDNHPQNATSATPYLWMASATFSSKTHKEVKPTNADSAWTKVCLTGEPGGNGFNGTDGSDGAGIEFIFTLIRNKDDISNLATPQAPNNTSDDSYPTGWEDHPQGIGYYTPNQITTTLSNLGNEELLFSIEMASMRKKSAGEESWGPYSAPFIWSMWGEDGIDGDGVEYIYFVTAEGNDNVTWENNKAILNPILYYGSQSYTGNLPINTEDVEQWGDEYQVSDWVPNGENGRPDLNWTDNPSDVGPDQPFEFVSVRKYRNEKWGPFSKPKLWAHWGGTTIHTTEQVFGSTNYIPYTCYAFCRKTETDLSNYRVVYDFSTFNKTSYSELTDDEKISFYNDPLNYIKTLKPDTEHSGQFIDASSEVTWSDTIPTNSGQLWLITAHIGDESSSTDTGWTSPRKWGDHAGFQTEYAVSDENTDKVYAKTITLPRLTDTNDSPNMTVWRQSVQTLGGGVWADDYSIAEPDYMATCYKDGDGVWSAWTVTKIKGEKGNPGADGQPGADGNGVEFVFFALTPQQYDNRTLFIENSNKFYVYDDIEHDNEVYTDSGYLPYALIPDGSNSILWATDTNPGITEERPYVFVSVRHQINGQWQKYNPIPGTSSTATTSSFGPASLWLAGDVIDYAYSEVDFDEDTIPVLVDSSNHPISRASNSSNGIEFYHGNKRLVYKSVEIKVNDEWLPFITVSTDYSSTSNYKIVETPVIFSQNITIYDAGSYVTNSTLQAIGIRLSFGNNYELDKPLEIPLKLISFESYIDSSGNTVFYSAEGVIKFIPVYTDTIVELRAGGIISKSTEDSDDYKVSSASPIGVFRHSFTDTVDIGFNGSFPTDSANWKIKVFFDNSQQYNIAIGNIYNSWRNNVWNNKDGEDADFNLRTDECSANYNPDGTIRDNTSTDPIYVHISKSFVKDSHSDYHYRYDTIFLWIDSNLPASLKDAIRFDLYDSETLIDSERISIFYNGKNGTSFEINNTPVATANVSNNGIVFNDETNTSIAELNIEHLNDFENAVDENIFTNISNMVQVDSTSGSYIGLKDVASFAVHSDEFITVTNNDGNVNISLNYPVLVNSLRNTLFGGNTPVVQTIQINDLTGSSDATLNNNGGILSNQGLTIQTTGLESVVSKGEDTFNVDTTNNVATINNVTSSFVVNTNTGSSYVDVGGNVNRSPKAPSVMAAARLISGYENIYPAAAGQTQIYDDAGYRTMFMKLNGNHSNSNVTYTLHLSKPLSIYTIDSCDAEAITEYTSDYNYLFTGKHSEIVINNSPNNEYNAEPIICLSFEDIAENTLISAYMTATVDDGDEPATTYKSATVYFRTTIHE